MTKIQTLAQLRKAVLDKKNELTPEEISRSKSFEAFMISGASSVLKAFDIFFPVDFKVFYDRASQVTAYTDSTSCVVNAGNELFVDGENIQGWYKLVMGVLFHELGHILYTPVKLFKITYTAIKEGELQLPSGLSEEDKETFNGLQSRINEELWFRPFFAGFYHQAENILEDGRMEKRLLSNGKRFLGFMRGLLYLRNKHFNLIEVEGEDSVASFFNLLLCYAKFEDTKDYDGTNEAFEEAKPIVDHYLASNAYADLADDVMKVVLIAWKYYIKDMEEDAEEGSSEDGEKTGDSEGGGMPASSASGKSSDSDESGEENSAKGKPSGGSGSKSDSKEDGEKEKSGGSASSASEKDERNEGSSSSSKPMSKRKIEDALREVEKIKTSETPDNEKSGEASSDAKAKDEAKEEDSDGSGNADDKDYNIEKIVKDVAEEIVKEGIVDDKNDEIRKIASDIEQMDPDVYVIKPDYSESSAKRILQDIENEISSIVNKTAREVSAHIQADQRTRKSKRKYDGKKFHAEKVVNKDFRYFERNSTKKDVAKIKVAVRVDESGSMWTNGRAEAARTAAICLYELAEKIPTMDIAIYGDTGDEHGCNSIEVFPYTDFGIKSNNDLYRLTSISARCQNRDEAAYRILAERLKKEDADVRLLIVISDGLPAACGYGGTAAAKSLRQVVEDYDKKGIQTVAMAIGSDKEEIMGIYGEKRFLDISDLSTLPKTLTSIVKRKL